jgi:GDP-mannose transporter
MLLANKLAIEFVPSPSAISFLQIVFATVTVIALRVSGYSSIDWFEWDRVRAYSYYVVIFVVTIYCNMKALEASNVETVIVFRACSPIAVSIIEYSFMDRELPNTRSALALGIVAFGAIAYCLSDSQLALNGLASYSWALVYFVLISVEMTYGKKLISSVKMDSVWGPVLYCNALSVVPMFFMGLGEDNFLTELIHLPQVSSVGMSIILFSCITGTLIGYTSWLCRGLISATTFTLVGVVNKFLTVLLNVLVWEKHSTPLGISAVCVCLLAGSFYQQAPRREISKIQEDVELTNQPQDDEEKQPLTGKSPTDSATNN